MAGGGLEDVGLQVAELTEDLRRAVDALREQLFVQELILVGGKSTRRRVFNIRQYVDNPDLPELQETYDAMNELVANAGHVTIGELFCASAEDIGPVAWRAIQRAKAAGFSQMNNGRCCKGGRCEDGKPGWCSRSPTGTGCSVTSDPCG